MNEGLGELKCRRHFVPFCVLGYSYIAAFDKAAKSMRKEDAPCQIAK